VITESAVNNAVTALLIVGIVLCFIGILVAVAGLAALLGFRVPADSRSVVPLFLWCIGVGVILIIVSVYLPLFLPR
jgi:uncharacterized membrane protein YidH (DUF202 family)